MRFFIYNYAMNIVLFDENEISSVLPSDDDRFLHITEILHKKVGETFSAGIIGGQAGQAKIEKLDKTI